MWRNIPWFTIFQDLDHYVAKCKSWDDLKWYVKWHVADTLREADAIKLEIDDLKNKEIQLYLYEEHGECNSLAIRKLQQRRDALLGHLKQFVKDAKQAGIDPKVDITDQGYIRRRFYLTKTEDGTEYHEKE